MNRAASKEYPGYDRSTPTDHAASRPCASRPGAAEPRGRTGRGDATGILRDPRGRTRVSRPERFCLEDTDLSRIRFVAVGHHDHYLRDKERREIDFLITRDGLPWLPVEAKLADPTPSPNWLKFLRQLPCDFGIQVCERPGRWTIHEREGRRLLVASAAEVLAYLA
jgi:hypothetical protein